MNVVKVRLHPNSDEQIIVNDDITFQKFLWIAKLLIANFAGTKTKELLGLDQVFIDVNISGSLVVLAWDSLAGFSIQCQNSTLREQILKFLESQSLPD